MRGGGTTESVCLWKHNSIIYSVWTQDCAVGVVVGCIKSTAVILISYKLTMWVPEHKWWTLPVKHSNLLVVCWSHCVSGAAGLTPQTQRIWGTCLKQCFFSFKIWIFTPPNYVSHPSDAALKMRKTQVYKNGESESCFLPFVIDWTSLLCLNLCWDDTIIKQRLSVSVNINALRRPPPPHTHRNTHTFGRVKSKELSWKGQRKVMMLSNHVQF